ncbi:ABC transporter permease [Streptomyces agglomeratus]|uniref:ABC transporter permease n=1 Tax=Streptomyces agglomeratus TaxID=285458 RepID=UPI00085445D9|nr:ABC transporter permease [Streptomyces agglomeratus]OEJ52655.1 ABC transporter permease [Streptomyces agglomeratus]
MTTATATRTPAPTGSVAGGNALAGTGTLIRFNLRRDRVRLPVWIVALLLGTLGTANNYKTLYSDPADRASLIKTMDSPGGLAMSGPPHYVSDYNVGAILGHQMLGFTAVMVALMSVLIITRHTRTEEETGRAELVRSTVVGRHAQLTAALTVAVIVNLVLALLMAFGLAGAGTDGIDTSGSLLYGFAHAAVGIVFAAVAMITVQFTAHSRGASGMALAVLGVAYVLRAAGDPSSSGALSWLSPIGWAQRTYVYVDNRWWPLLLCLALAVACAAAGFVLSTRRDVGAGLRAARLGSPEASESLSRPFGFALRLHRSTLAGFAIGLFLMSAMYGSILGNAEETLKNIDPIQEALEEIGGASMAESFASMIMVIIALVAGVYVVMASLRPRAEENAGRAEPLLATGLSRRSWVGSHLVVAMTGGTAVLLLSGIGLGLAGAASASDGSLFLKLVGAALAYAPALWVTAGIAVVLFGWFPRASAAAWIVPVYGFVVGYLGELLQFPDWLNLVSPFGHVPQLPAAEMEWTPMAVLTLVAAGLVWLGLEGFRRRDLETK